VAGECFSAKKDVALSTNFLAFQAIWRIMVRYMQLKLNVRESQELLRLIASLFLLPLVHGLDEDVL
jgi:hypothetical protein